ncbi:MAG: hypothetical protein WBW75_14055 [Mycobacterium sp.]|uniref:hypothetical protein n=1 Tax=Mycobacterium sp. TaxID=1785 RepID=UPI003C6AB75B
MDSDEVDDQAATVAGDSDVTTSVPPQTEAAGPERARSQVDDTDEPTRHPRHSAWATAGVLVPVR